MVLYVKKVECNLIVLKRTGHLTILLLQKRTTSNLFEREKVFNAYFRLGQENGCRIYVNIMTEEKLSSI